MKNHFLLLFIAWASLLSAQNQVGGDLLGDSGGERFGHAVAVTPDGNTMVVSTSVSLSQSDVRVFQFTNGSWTQVGPTITDPSGASAFSHFGYDVAVSANGSQIFISDLGVPDPNGNSLEPTTSPGSVYRYIFFNPPFGSPQWILSATVTGETNGDRFGHSIDVSDDGDYLLVGAPGKNANAGAVYRFLSNDITLPYGQIDLVEGSGSGYELGTSVAITGDGQRFAAGFPGKFGGRGGFLLSGPGGTGGTFNGTINGERMGQSIDLSGNDGSRIAIGAPGNNSNTGRVVFYRWDASTPPAETYTPRQGTVPGGRFGAAVSLSDDGNWLAVGAPGAPDDLSVTGTAALYTQSAFNGYLRRPTLLTGSPDRDFGYSVAMSDNGLRMVVGEPGYVPPGGLFSVGRTRAFNVDCTAAPGAVEIPCNGIDENCDGTENITFAGNRMYVDKNATGTGDGMSWANAIPSLQDALRIVECTLPVTEIWVAAGTYYPDEGFGIQDNDQQSRFTLVEGIDLYGGFAGTETALDQRDYNANRTILSADFNQNGVNEESTDGFYLLFAKNISNDSGTRLDGFTLSGATTSYGEGRALEAIDASLTLLNCRFENNAAVSGGAVRTNNSRLTFYNCVFRGNRVYSNGGAIANSNGGENLLINCTLSGNKALSDGGAIFNPSGCEANLINTIVWNNDASLNPFDGNKGVSIENLGDLFASHSLIENFDGSGLGNNSDTNLDGTDPTNNPLFVADADPDSAPNTSGDLRLMSCSPVIDQGADFTVFPGLGTLDLDANPRLFGAAVDLGAYELQQAPTTSVVCYQDSDGDGFGNPNVVLPFCGTCGTGYVATANDCNDNQFSTTPAVDPSDFPAAEKVWIGCVSGSWLSPLNWEDGTLPTANEVVTIPDTPNDPFLQFATSVAAIRILDGAQLTILNNGDLTVTGSGPSGAGVSIAPLGTLINDGILRAENLTASAGLLNEGTVSNTGTLQFSNLSGGNALVNRNNFSNSGSLFLNGVGGVGIEHTPVAGANAFANTGTIRVDGTTGDGILVNGGIFENADSVEVGLLAAVGNHGIHLTQGTWNNTTTAVVRIGATGSDGIHLAAGTNWNNDGRVEVTNATNNALLVAGAGSGGSGGGGNSFSPLAGTLGWSLMEATYFNNTTAITRLDNPVNNDGFIQNLGSFYLDTPQPSTNTGNFLNEGNLDDIQGSLVNLQTPVNNQDILIQPIATDICGAAMPALQLGPQQNSTVCPIWYTDEALTQPAGDYDAATNTFQTNGTLLPGEQTLYFSGNENGMDDCVRKYEILVNVQVENENPVANCPTELPTVVLDANSNIVFDENALQSAAIAAATDNCGVVSATNTPITASCTDETVSVTLTVFDAVGNSDFIVCNLTVDNSAVLQTFYADTDNDGFGDPGVSQMACSAPDGFVAGNTDCDDTRNDVFPGAPELCDGVDNDCDGDIDEEVQTTFYADTDNDGFGDPAVSQTACSAPNGFVTDNTDCDDTRDDVFPGAPELCDGVDNDCDGDTDEDGQTLFYEDLDGDNFGNSNISIMACVAPDGFVANNNDCDDANPDVFPGAPELCDGVDNDCNGDTDENPDCTTDPYCPSTGLSTEYEWIEAVGVNGTTNTSGNNGGYADFTQNTPFEFAAGQTNNFLLSPGFAGQRYREFWTVYLDLNHDNAFTADELVYYKRSKWNINGSFFLPVGTPTGTMRMRVIMSYQWYQDACGDFANGEVEDYLVNITYTPPTYCDVTGQSTQYEWIERVRFAGLDHTSGDDGGYGDHTTHAAAVLQGQSYLFKGNPGYAGTPEFEYWTAWADWNQDGDFNDAGELLFDRRKKGPMNKWFYVPSWAPSGVTRIRVAMRYGGWAYPCTDFQYGEVEDYTLLVGAVGGNGGGNNLVQADENTPPAEDFTIFEAHRRGLTADLTWSTTESIKSDRFVVERSADGVTFDSIGVVTNLPDTRQPTPFALPDAQPLTGDNFYRLRLVTPRGEVTHSEVRHLHFEDHNGWTVFPNPANDYTLVDLRSFAGKAAHLEVVDASGRVRLQRTFQTLPDAPVRLDLTEFLDGTYRVFVKVDGRRAQARTFVVARL